MTRTGYSCTHLRRRTKHGCQSDIEHWCNATGCVIDPMSCNQRCNKFRTLADQHRPAKTKKLEDELL
jgi:hypothetical protein